MLTSNKEGTNKYAVEIIDMELHIRLLRLAPSAISSYELSLAKSPFTVNSRGGVNAPSFLRWTRILIRKYFFLGTFFCLELRISVRFRG